MKDTQMEAMVRKLSKVSAKKLEEKRKAEPKPEVSKDGLLTDAQVENWRRVLFGIVGPYALIMSKEDIQLWRNQLQKGVDNLPKTEEQEDTNG